MKKNRREYRVNELESKALQVDVVYTHRVLRSMVVDDRRPQKIGTFMYRNSAELSGILAQHTGEKPERKTTLKPLSRLQGHLWCWKRQGYADRYRAFTMV